jgi:hypothetical protein
VDGPFVGSLLDNRDSRGQGSPGFFCRLLTDGGPDGLDDIFYPCAVRFVPQVPDLILSGSFYDRFMCCQSLLLLSKSSKKLKNIQSDPICQELFIHQGVDARSRMPDPEKKWLTCLK